MEYTVEVPYIKQETPTTCWNAGYKMMLRYNKQSEDRADKLPNDAEMRTRGILDTEFNPCRQLLGLACASHDGFSTPEKLRDRLEDWGAIWCAGYWASDFSVKEKPDFKHIVVVRGVRTNLLSADEVFVNDPYRGFSGASARASWWSWSHFWSKLHKVPGNCQFWFNKPSAKT